MKYDIIMWLVEWNFIGGIETSCYSFCQRLRDRYNILVLYDTCDPKQLERMKTVTKMERYDPNKSYECDILLYQSFWKFMPKTIKSTYSYQVIHGDFVAFKIKWDRQPYVTGYINVSETGRRGLLVSSNIESIVMGCLNQLKHPTKKVLHLISCTRLTPEKGYERMRILVDLLRNNGIRFDWKIFSNMECVTKEQRIKYPEVIHMPADMDVMDYIADSDYGVQLSDTEGYCYFVHECLQYNVPVLVTDIPAFQNVIEDGKNGYKVNLDMSNVDISKIYNDIPKFEHVVDDTSFESWSKFLHEAKKRDVLVLHSFYDKELKKYIRKGDVVRLTSSRVDELSNTTVPSFKGPLIRPIS